MRNKEEFYDITISKTEILSADYEECKLIGCNGGKSMSGASFTDCIFENCDLSIANLHNVTFNNIEFIGCKMLGLQFQDCSHLLFSVRFEHCALNMSSFYDVKMKDTEFSKCTLKETDFSQSDLTNATFDECDLHLAIFEQTNLEGADLRTSFGFSIDPELNRIKKAKFSMDGVGGLLDKYGIIIE